MAIGFTEDSNYTEIAKAIRKKLNNEETFTPAEMAVAIEAIETGVALDPLANQAPANKIFKGYSVYNSEGEVIDGSAMGELSKPATSNEILYGYEAYNPDGDKLTGTALAPLTKPATSVHVLSGYEAYNDKGEKIEGQAIMQVGYLEIVLDPTLWNGTTYTYTTNDWTLDTSINQVPLMDLPTKSSAPNARAVVESAITMPYYESTATSITFTFSAVRTPTEEVTVAIFNIIPVETTTT